MILYCKMREKFITKCVRSLLRNALGFLLQNGIVILQNAVVITKCNDFITKCDIYYKLRRLLKHASVHTETFYLGEKEQIFHTQTNSKSNKYTI